MTNPLNSIAPPNTSYNSDKSLPALIPSGPTNPFDPRSNAASFFDSSILFPLSPSYQDLSRLPPSLNANTFSLGPPPGSSSRPSAHNGARMEQQGPSRPDANRSSPSGSSSQGDMADTEMDARSSNPPVEQQTSAPPPPKKKRTRTLTTPHQSAVLHALLAQSRFPTTAMREEVGRSIGLSARKVQIWFQNQRQKARRPRGQTNPLLSRPPQYGPFPNVPSGTSGDVGIHSEVNIGPPARLGDPSPEMRMRDPRPYTAPQTSVSSSGVISEYFRPREPYADNFGREMPIPQLSGPGVPGLSGESSSSQLPRRDAGYPMGSHAIPLPSPFPSARPSTAGELQFSSRHHSRSLLQRRRRFDQDFPISIPPLKLGRSASPPTPGPSNRPYSLSPLEPLASAPPILPPLHDPKRVTHLSRHADSPFAHEVPSRLPPPFTLQPAPQWDDISFSPFSRTGNTNEPRPYHAGGATTDDDGHYPFPPLNNLQLQEYSTASAPSELTLPPIRTRFDTLRPTTTSPLANQALQPGSSSGQGPPSSTTQRSYTDDTSGKYDGNH